MASVPYLTTQPDFWAATAADQGVLDRRDGNTLYLTSPIDLRKVRFPGDGMKGGDRPRMLTPDELERLAFDLRVVLSIPEPVGEKDEDRG